MASDPELDSHRVLLKKYYELKAKYEEQGRKLGAARQEINVLRGKLIPRGPRGSFLPATFVSKGWVPR